MPQFTPPSETPDLEKLTSSATTVGLLPLPSHIGPIVVVHCNGTFNLVHPFFLQLLYCCNKLLFFFLEQMCTAQTILEGYGVLAPLTPQIQFIHSFFITRNSFLDRHHSVLCVNISGELWCPGMVHNQNLFFRQLFPKDKYFYIFFGMLTIVLPIIVCFLI